MRLLLTRAAADGARTKEKLEARGHHVVISPVIEFVGTGATWPPGVVDAVLATSGQAFAMRLDALSPEVRRLVPLFLVGTHTAELAVTNGFLGPAMIAKNAATLALEIGRADRGAKRIVYLAGRDRKPDIETALAGLGHELDVVEVYEARALDSPSTEAARAFRHGDIDVLLHYSRRSATLFLATAAAHGLDLRTCAHLCLSEDVAVPLREAGLDEIHVADDPREDSLLSLLGDPDQADQSGGC